jgi:hypothetical protein
MRARMLNNRAETIAEGLQLCELDPDENSDELTELAVRMLRVWFDQVFPQIEAAAVELRMTGAIGGVAVQGTADHRRRNAGRLEDSFEEARRNLELARAAAYDICDACRPGER